MTGFGSDRRYVTSADGTRIAVAAAGSGRPLVICHGSLGTTRDWASVAKLLAPQLTVYTYDRRGRGDSDDGLNHSLRREQEDLAAVLDLAGPDAVVFGHSYGGVIALALALERSIDALAVYEPPIPVGSESWGEVLVAYERALSEGDKLRALEIGMRGFVQLTEDVIESMRGTQPWHTLSELAPTGLREARAVEAFGGAVERFAALTMPTLFLVGEDSDGAIVEASSRLARAVPDSQWVKLAGQTHFAHTLAPGTLAEAMLSFIRATRGSVAD